MKIKALLVLLFPCLLFMSCSSALKNDITVKNAAAENVYLNILGRIVTVKPGSTQIIENVAKGSYDYSTAFTLPSGVSASSVEGKGSGTVALGPGTHIAIYYTSRIQIATGSGQSGQATYVLVVTVSTSDPSSTTTTGS